MNLIISVVVGRLLGIGNDVGVRVCRWLFIFWEGVCLFGEM